MATYLYHKDVFAPEKYFRSPGVVRLHYGHHAKAAAVDDRFGNLSQYLRPYVDIDEAEVVEVEVTDGAVTKRVLRIPVKDDLALVMVVMANGFVRTVWGNLATDTHKSLDRGRYVPKPLTH